MWISERARPARQDRTFLRFGNAGGRHFAGEGSGFSRESILDGQGVVWHAGSGKVRELADLTGHSARVRAVLADTCRGAWVFARGPVFADLAGAVVDGADCIDDVGQRCGDREHVFGALASMTTIWRLVDVLWKAEQDPRVTAVGQFASAWTRFRNSSTS